MKILLISTHNFYNFNNDKTMLNEWFKEAGFNLNKVDGLMHFECMSAKPRYNDKGRILAPLKKDMHDHYNNTLRSKIKHAKVVIYLGYIPLKYFGFNNYCQTINNSGQLLCTLINPSEQNRSKYEASKDNIIHILKYVIDYAS